MKAKLIKTKFGFKLNNLDGVYIASVATGKLSIKNCQAIERGYDLDELAEAEYPILNLGLNATTSLHTLHQESFKLGFQKALEILGDKKFSEEDMIEFGDWLVDYMITEVTNLSDSTKELLQIWKEKSLQQTEWDVEIEMICPHPEDTYVCGIQYGCDEDGCNHLNKVHFLDADGCLILKRI